MYDSNNLVLSLLYQIPTTSQRCQWVVGYGRYRILGDNLTYDSQKTILMLGTASSIVKIIKDEHEVLDTFLNVQMLLHLLLSLNCLIHPHVMT